MVAQIELSKDSLNAFIKNAQEKLNIDHASWHKYVSETKFTIPLSMSIDEGSEEYFNYQLDLWKLISGRPSYSEEDCEKNDHIVPIPSIRATYPFTSNNSTEIGNYFFGVSNIVRKIGLPVNSKVVEFGIGYGHVTRLLANMGYEVHAIDIEERFLDILPAFHMPGSNSITTEKSSFTGAVFQDRSVDAFVFFECFHHCIGHARLIQTMARALRPGGRILFAAEAFYDDWFDFAWGVRLDGHAVWAIRNFGWMELGFRKSYITSLLESQNFELEWSSISDVGSYGEMLVATLRG